MCPSLPSKHRIPVVESASNHSMWTINQLRVQQSPSLNNNNNSNQLSHKISKTSNNSNSNNSNSSNNNSNNKQDN